MFCVIAASGLVGAPLKSSSALAPVITSRRRRDVRRRGRVSFVPTPVVNTRFHGDSVVVFGGFSPHILPPTQYPLWYGARPFAVSSQPVSMPCRPPCARHVLFARRHAATGIRGNAWGRRRTRDHDTARVLCARTHFEHLPAQKVLLDGQQPKRRKRGKTRLIFDKTPPSSWINIDRYCRYHLCVYHHC